MDWAGQRTRFYSVTPLIIYNKKQWTTNPERIKGEGKVREGEVRGVLNSSRVWWLAQEPCGPSQLTRVCWSLPSQPDQKEPDQRARPAVVNWVVPWSPLQMCPFRHRARQLWHLAAT